MFLSLINLFTIPPTLVFGKTASQLCRGTASLSNGNWYCSQVNAITYKNISQSGEYNQTTRVDPSTGLCDHEPLAYAGVEPATPLIGELSIHLRGPMNISQLAVYKLPGFGTSRRAIKAYKNEQELKRRGHDLKDFNASISEIIDTIFHRSGSTALSNEATTPSSDALTTHQSLGICTFTPTITTTVYIRPSTCGLSRPSASISPSLVQPTTQPAPPLPAPPPPPPATIPGQPTVQPIPPPAVAPPPLPPPPPITIPPAPPLAATRTIHDTITVRPISQSFSSAPPSGALELHCSFTSHAPECPCNTNSNVPAPQVPAVVSTGCPGYSSSPQTPTGVIRGKRDSASSSSSQGDDIGKAAVSTWNRVAYYTSTAPAAATGFAFLANLGDPAKSGTFDYSFGNSLSYVIGDGSKVTANNTPFDGTLATSEREIAVFTDEACNGGCDYSRPDTVTHYGWDGPSKAFFIEFQMDHYNNTGFDQGMLSDAPAYWFLNAAIPRILQYGNDRNNIPCSCWSTGCGEFDAFEVLGQGEMRAKSTIHRQGNLEGGDSNYFLRPVGKAIKFAVVFHDWNITARVLDDGFDFGQGLTQNQIDDVLAYDENDGSHSLFLIGT